MGSSHPTRDPDRVRRRFPLGEGAEAGRALPLEATLSYNAAIPADDLVRHR